jgi:GT2 family glycosyltransferase
MGYVDFVAYTALSARAACFETSASWRTPQHDTIPAILASVFLTASLLTHNSEKWARKCLETLVSQEELNDFQIVCLDNASSDKTYLDDLEKDFPEVIFIRSEENLGFSKGHNKIMREYPATYHAVLNIDAIFESDFLYKLTKALEDNPNSGSSTGKLFRWDLGADPEKTEIIDSAGIAMTSSHRFYDRAQGREEAEPISDEYDYYDICFGGTGAATVYRRAALEECKIEQGFFDERMFMYKEDVDLAYRLMKNERFCIFVPDAIGWHARATGTSRKRRSMQERIYSAAHESLILNKHRSEWTFRTRILTRIRQIFKWTYLLIFESKVFFGARKLLKNIS